jgi:mannosyl-oligosaccharide alpha-1,2-mannosidase
MRTTPVFHLTYDSPPQTVESLYIMWRVTRDEKWRDMGWRIFEALEREARTPVGYANLHTVDVAPGMKQDAMPR